MCVCFVIDEAEYVVGAPVTLDILYLADLPVVQ